MARIRVALASSAIWMASSIDALACVDVLREYETGIASREQLDDCIDGIDASTDSDSNSAPSNPPVMSPATPGEREVVPKRPINGRDGYITGDVGSSHQAPIPTVLAEEDAWLYALEYYRPAIDKCREYGGASNPTFAQPRKSDGQFSMLIGSGDLFQARCVVIGDLIETHPVPRTYPKIVFVPNGSAVSNEVISERKVIRSRETKEPVGWLTKMRPPFFRSSAVRESYR